MNIDDFQEKDVKELDFGPMDQVCEFCGAKFWNAERNSDGTYSKCCNNGKIKLPPVRPPPPYVKELLLGISPSAKIFKNKARAFNTKSSFASVTMKQSLFPSTRGVPAMRISGSVYHNIGAIHPEANVQAKFMQTFFYESEQLPNDFEFNVQERQIHSCILQEIRNFNPFLRSVQQALDAHAGIPLFRLIISDKPPPNTATRTYNQPTSVEISAIIVGADDSTAAPSKRDVIIQSRGGGLRRIPSIHSSYDPLAYVFTHMHGDTGWHPNIPPYILNDEGVFVPNFQKRVTQLDYYAYRLHTQDPIDANDIILDSLTYRGMLKQQFDCDNYLKIEEARLQWQKDNQKQLKAESYSGLADAVAANENRQAGTYVILSSSFIGSPRHNHQLYQDAMAMVRKHGRPELFITFTCNPKWREIVDNLRPGDLPHERNDLMARVFKMKLKELLHDLTKQNVLGKTVGHTYVIEFQKRGLPHAHILLILQRADKFLTSDDYDSVVCAEIPNPVTCPDLYNIITRQMMHGPCGHLNPDCVCMDRDLRTCTKHFPKQKSEQTSAIEDSFPIYRRRCLHLVTEPTTGGRHCLR